MENGDSHPTGGCTRLHPDPALHGMRSIEERNLTAKEVNLGARTFTLLDTKMRRDIDLPIVTQLLPVFSSAYQGREYRRPSPV